MIEALINNSILLLFFTMAIGYGIGEIKVGNFSLGVAAVLFIGLLIGGLSEDIQVPQVFIAFGLAIYLYSIGLTSGPSFFNNMQKNGLRDISVILLMLILSAIINIGLCAFFDYSAARTAGIFAGATTNTPALAGLLDVIHNLHPESTIGATQAQDAVGSYSFSYPLGILGTLIALLIMIRLFNVDFGAEEKALGDTYQTKKDIVSASVKITNSLMCGPTLRDLKRTYHMKVVFGRMIRDENISLSNFDTIFEFDDKVFIVGDKEEVDRVIHLMGQRQDKSQDEYGSSYISKRIFVSNPDIAGQKISTLNLQEHFSAIVTRVRRGDIDLLADPDTVLELGDMVRFVCRRKDTKGLSKFFGDSYESLGTVNLFTFAGGLSLGLYLGMINFNLPGDISFKLGYAGGPMVVGLVMGTIRRTGQLVWTVPYSANLTFRQFGLSILLAGIGINSGYNFISHLFEIQTLYTMLIAILVAFATGVLTLVIGYKLFKIPFSILGGMLAHQPALLDFLIQRTKNNLPMVGYTTMLPIALVIKIIIVQLMYLLLP